jgi:hypothetical protein
MKILSLIAAIMLWGAPADAQRNDIVIGPHGGKLQEVSGIEVELLIGETEVTLYVYSLEKVLLDVRRYSASVDIVAGGHRELISLRPEETTKLVGNSKALLRPYSALTLYITVPGSATASVPF